MAEMDRERARQMRCSYNKTAEDVMNILEEKPVNAKPTELTKENLRMLDEVNQKEEAFKKKKKLEKPVWAQTKEEVEKKENE